jgi:hypothetical protein
VVASPLTSPLVVGYDDDDVSLRLFVSISGEHVRCMMMTSIVDPCVNDDASCSVYSPSEFPNVMHASASCMCFNVVVYEESPQKRLPKNIYITVVDVPKAGL